MFISLDWISDFVDLSDIDPKTIADRLTMSTAEVEGIHEIKRLVQNVVVGEIIEASPITRPDGKKLTVCKISLGDHSAQTVCGAPNVRTGLKVPFVPAGSFVQERSEGEISTKEIVKTEMEGFASEGILASAFELGLSDWHEIVFEIPSSVPTGTPLAELIPETDVLIEIDNKSLTHRPDCWGHYGIARELAAIFHRPLAPLARYSVDRFDNLPAYPIEIADENCPCYSGILFGINAGSVHYPSPITMQRRLHALGQRTYNLLVDLTNYVSFELGQPTHAFDADTISKIRVAPMGNGGEFVTLDGQKRKMIPEDMMICDGDKPIAIAGIMGGLETEVTSKTTRIMLESANFKAARIRRTAGRLDLRTDASQRYEKSQPPANVKVAAERILQLLVDSGTPFEVQSRFSLAGDLGDRVRTITIKPGRLNALAGIDFPNETVLSILHSIGFGAKFLADGSLQVGIPPFRSVKDISIPEDIVEEVMRLYGFDNVPPIMPEAPLKPLYVDESIKMEHRARRLLAGAAGFMEVHNYCWMNDSFLKKIGYDPGETLELQNPAVQSESRLRTTLLPNLLALVPKNRPNMDSFRIFELGHVFFLKGKKTDCSPCVDSAEKCEERPRLAGLSYLASGLSAEDHYLEIKGAVEDLGKLFGQDEFPLTFAAGKGSPLPWKTEGLWVEIFQDGQKIGSLGMADKSLTTTILSDKDKGQIVWFEIELDKFKGNLYPSLHFTEPPKFPCSWQDFSIVWSMDAGYQALDAKLAEFSHPLLKSRSFLVAYKGKGLEKGFASYSFRFIIGADDHTLTGEELEAFHTAVLEFLKKNEINLRA